MLMELQAERIEQLDLFDTVPASADVARDAGGVALMQTVDQINARFGCGAVRLAGAGFTQGWANRQERLTPAYTTQWDQLPIVRA